jgi:5-methylcytosine-specific restriction enzyme A
MYGSCEFVCAGYDLEMAPDGAGTLRQAIVFNLVPASEIDDSATLSTANGPGAQTPDLQTMRLQALAAVSTPAYANRTLAKRNVYERSSQIRAYVLARANGQCEACAHPAPFVSMSGTPYLEPHHIRRLGDGGPDDPRFMAAVCPNCHREIHHGAQGRSLNERLQIAVTTREATLEQPLNAGPEAG